MEEHMYSVQPVTRWSIPAFPEETARAVFLNTARPGGAVVGSFTAS